MRLITFSKEASASDNTIFPKVYDKPLSNIYDGICIMRFTVFQAPLLLFLIQKKDILTSNLKNKTGYKYIDSVNTDFQCRISLPISLVVLCTLTDMQIPTAPLQKPKQKTYTPIKDRMEKFLTVYRKDSHK